MARSIAFFVLSLVFLTQNAIASSNGIIGFGLALWPDLCCQACHDSLSALYLSCTTFMDDMDMGGMDMGGMDMEGMDMPMGETSDDCRATNTPWLQTMAYCIQQKCKDDGYPVEKQATCFSNQALGGASKPTFEESLPATAPTVELTADAMWLNVTSLVNADLYTSTHGSEAEFIRSEYFHTRYAVTLYLIVIGICIICGILAQSASIFPAFHIRLRSSKLWSKLQAYVFLPALLGTRRLQPLPANLGYIPGRTLSIFIGIYIILNIIFSSVSFHSYQPNTFWKSKGFELCEYVGNRTGTLSLVNMSIAILFAGRNNLLIALTGWTQTTFLTLHRWTARMAALQAVVHSICYTAAYFEPGYGGAKAYAAEAAMPFYYWGIIATIAMCLATAFAILPFRLNFYETFLILHIALVILTLVGCWYHLVPHFGLIYGYQVWLYICFAFWSADRLARFLRLAYYNRFGLSKAIVETIPDSNVLQITVFPRSTWKFGPGQHSFIYLPGLGKFWESHPFSVAGWTKLGDVSSTAPGVASRSNSSEKGAKITETQVGRAASVKFMIRAHAGMTSSLRRRLSLSSSGAGLELKALTEGPYAGHRAALHPVFAADTVLCLAGGIGITHILGFVQAYANAHFQRLGGETQTKKRHAMVAKRFILAWSARESTLIEHVRQNFLVEVEGIECSFWCTGSSQIEERRESVDDESPNRSNVGSGKGAAAKTGRMNIESVVRAVMEPNQQITVVSCAPGSMADEITRQVARCAKDGFNVELVEEAFAW